MQGTQQGYTRRAAFGLAFQTENGGCQRKQLTVTTDGRLNEVERVGFTMAGRAAPVNTIAIRPSSTRNNDTQVDRHLC